MIYRLLNGCAMILDSVGVRRKDTQDVGTLVYLFEKMEESCSSGAVSAKKALQRRSSDAIDTLIPRLLADTNMKAAAGCNMIGIPISAMCRVR